MLSIALNPPYIVLVSYFFSVHILGCIQMSAVIILGCLQRRHPLALFSVSAVPSPTKMPLFSKDMAIIGSFRFITVFLGLYALKYVEVSFTETVKSTAPAFTLLGGYTSSLLLNILSKLKCDFFQCQVSFLRRKPV